MSRDIVTRYIPSGLSENNKLPLGNLDACRDWGHAADMCRGILLIMEQKKPQDFVLATGETHSVIEFLQESFKTIGLPSTKEYIMKFVKVDPRFYRPCDLEYLCGDYSRVKKDLGWYPKTTFRDLVRNMVQCEIDAKFNKCIKLEV